jgi:hypothetical protein
VVFFSVAVTPKGTVVLHGLLPQGWSICAYCRELRKWADTTEKAHATLHARREARAGRLASALRALEKV